jgi:hypothetical protein
MLLFRIERYVNSEVGLGVYSLWVYGFIVYGFIGLWVYGFMGL